MLILLAGCMGPPDPPADAQQDTDAALPGLTLSTWIEPRQGRVQLHALVVNDHTDGYWYRVNCHHPWNITLEAPDGRSIEFRRVPMEPGCAPQQDILQPKQYLDSMWSWDARDHDPEQGTSVPVEDGAYTWTAAFAVRDSPVELAVTYHIRVVDGVLGNVTLAG